MKKWLLKKVTDWFPLERIAAAGLNALLDYSNTRAKAQSALKIARRVHEASGAAIAALSRLLGDEVNTASVSTLMDSVERLAIRAWSKGESTPNDARHLKEPKDETS